MATLHQILTSKYKGVTYRTVRVSSGNWYWNFRKEKHGTLCHGITKSSISAAKMARKYIDECTEPATKLHRTD